MRIRSLASVILLTTSICLPASAWTPRTEERIATKAAQLAPPDMRLLLDRYSESYKAGIAEAALEERQNPHLFIQRERRGVLRDSLHNEIQRAITALRTREPMSATVQRLGRIAHLVADANNPFHTNDTQPRLTPMRADFESYQERRLVKIPTVFYGLDRSLHVPSYLDRMFARSARFYPLLAEEYFRHGEQRTSAEFDDRSTAFGIASISYSRAVSDTVNLFYYIWKEAGGDVRSAAAMERGTLLLSRTAAPGSAAAAPTLGRTESPAPAQKR